MKNVELYSDSSQSENYKSHLKRPREVQKDKLVPKKSPNRPLINKNLTSSADFKQSFSLKFNREERSKSPALSARSS